MHYDGEHINVTKGGHMKFVLCLILVSSLLHASAGTQKTVSIINKTGSLIHLLHPEDERVHLVMEDGSKYRIPMDPTMLKSLSCLYYNAHNDGPLLLRAEDIDLTDKMDPNNEAEIRITDAKDADRIFVLVTFAKGKKSRPKDAIPRSLTRNVSVELIRYAMEQVSQDPSAHPSSDTSDDVGAIPDAQDE